MWADQKVHDPVLNSVNTKNSFPKLSPLNTHSSVIRIPALVLGHKGLETVPAYTGQGQGQGQGHSHTLEMSPVYHRAGTMGQRTVHNCRQVTVSYSPDLHVFGLWEKTQKGFQLSAGFQLRIS